MLKVVGLLVALACVEGPLGDEVGDVFVGFLVGGRGRTFATGRRGRRRRRGHFDCSGGLRGDKDLDRHEQPLGEAPLLVLS